LKQPSLLTEITLFTDWSNPGYRQKQPCLLTEATLPYLIITLHLRWSMKNSKGIPWYEGKSFLP